MAHQGILRDELISKGVSRRDFMKYCGTLTAALGLSPMMAPRLAEALAKKRQPVVYLSFAECTGCAESLLRTTYPSIEEVLFELISLDYHETVMAASGQQSEDALHSAVKDNEGKFICIVDGSIPTKKGYGMIGGQEMIDIVKEIVPKALATICVGTCASFGGLPVAAPNPSGAKSVKEVTGVDTINISGCPPNSINIVGTIAHYLLLGKLPELDGQGRPLWAYGMTIHESCPRRAHYEEGNFVAKFGDEGAMNDWCLFEMGCKGPETHSNCALVKWNQGVNWPIGAGHPCIGCTEPEFWDKMSPFYVSK